MSDLFQRIAQNAQPAMQSQMDGLRDIVQQRISVPVVRQGGKTIRSKPGDPPRKDSGDLYTSTSAQTADSGFTVQGSVSVNTPYAKRLNNQMNRPIFGNTLADNRDAIRAALRDAIISTKGS